MTFILKDFGATFATFGEFRRMFRWSNLGLFTQSINKKKPLKNNRALACRRGLLLVVLVEETLPHGLSP